MKSEYTVTILSHYKIVYRDDRVGKVTFETDLRETTPWVDLRATAPTEDGDVLDAGEMLAIGKRIERYLIEQNGYRHIELITR